MKTAITGTVNKISIPVIVDGEEIAVISFNPLSSLVMRNAANVFRLLNGDVMCDSDAPENDGEAVLSEIEELRIKSAPLIKMADFIDDIIAASDKLFGVGVTESILEYDDDNMNLLKSTFETVFERIKEAREPLTDKYRA